MITSKTISSSVKIFLQVNYIQITTTFNKNLIFKWNKSTIQSQNTILLNISTSINNTIQAIFTWYDNIFEELNQLREKKISNGRRLEFNWIILDQKPHLLQIPLLSQHHKNLCQNIILTTHSRKCSLYQTKDLINPIKYLKSNKKNWSSWEKTNMNNKRILDLNWFLSNKKHCASHKIQKW